MGRLHGLVLILLAVPASAALTPELDAAVARVKWTPERVDRLIKEMPKAELHLHLDGALSPETIARLAKEQDYAPLKGKSPKQIAALSVVSSAQPSLAKVLEAFKVVYPLLRRADAVETAAYEAAKAAAASGALYIEVRFAPELQSAPGFTASDALTAALKGLKRAETDFGVKSGVILCLLRPDSLVDMKRNAATTRLAIDRAKDGVVGVDLAGDESKAPLARYAFLLIQAKQAGLGVTVHAGEVPGSKDLQVAVDMGVDRLGHATLLAADPKLLERVAARRIPVEVNLTSNQRTSAVKDLKKHPAKAWRKAGVPLAVSTDDPGVFAVDLDHEYRLLVSELGFTARDLIEVSLDAVDASFQPKEKRVAMRRDFEARLLAQLEPPKKK